MAAQAAFRHPKYLLITHHCKRSMPRFLALMLRTKREQVRSVAELIRARHFLREYLGEQVSLNTIYHNLNKRLLESQSHLEELERNLSSLEREASHETDILNACTYGLFTWDALITRRQAEIDKKAPHDRMIRYFDDGLAPLYSARRDLSTKLQSAQALLSKSTPLSKPFADNENVDDLNSKKEKESQDLKEKINTKRSYEDNIAEENRQIKAFESQLSEQSQRQSLLESDTFIIALRDRPNELLRKLFDTLITRLSSFEHDHPEWQGVNVRASQLTLQKKALFVFNNPDVAGTDENDKIRRQYYQLSGLIRHAMQLSGNEGGGKFRSCLDSIFGDHAIAPKDALEEYEALRNTYQNIHQRDDVLKDLSKEDIETNDQREYQAAVETYREYLRQVQHDAPRLTRQFFAAGEHLLDEINGAKNLSDHARVKSFDVVLHTKILRAATNVLLNPQSESNRDELDRLSSSNTDGKPSPTKKVLGGIAMFLGGALAIAAGIAFAMTLVGLPASIAMFAGGGLLFAGGLMLVVSGRQKGLDKAYSDYRDIAAKPQLVVPQFVRNQIYAPPAVTGTHQNLAETAKPSAPPL